METRPVTLSGQTIRLEPLRHDHTPALFAAASLEIFQFMRGRPAEWTEVAFAGYVDRAIRRPASLAFAIILLEKGQPIGVTCYLRIDSANRGIEVGGTWIAQDYQGTAVNPESKLLLLRHAFETLGVIRVAIVTDERNIQSQRAIEKLGATREGVLRKHSIMPDGHIRNTVFYSIVDDEWPKVKAGLEARIDTKAIT